MTESTTQSTPNEQEAKSDINTHRMIFYALMEAAMRYREGFWREDIENYDHDLTETNKGLWEKSSFAQRTKIDKWRKNKVLEFKQSSERLNAQMYGVIEALNESLSPGAKVAFDNYSTAYGLTADELAKAKNTTEFITVCSLYNSGALNHMFEQAEAKITNDNINKTYENKNPISGIDGDSHASLQEKELEPESEPFDSSSDPTTQH